MNKALKHIFALGAGIVCIITYIMTLHPSVGFIDCGELAAACYTFGVPHPTGYPLFLIIGFIVSHLPLGSSVIYRLNLLSAVETAAAVVVTFYSAVILLQNLVPALIKSKPKPNQKQKNQPVEAHTGHVSDMQIYFLAAMSAVSVGFVKSLWFEATQVEVYGLHTLFISIIFYYCIKILFNIKFFPKKAWAFLFLFLGLSLANHSTTIYFIPAIAYLLYLQYKESGQFFKSILPYVLLVLPGFLFYILLFAAASAKPYLNWSDIHDLSSFMSHVRGSDFTQLMFSSSSGFSANTSAFFKTLPGELAVLPGIAGLVGLVAVWKTNRRLFIVSMLMILTCLLYSFNYQTIEIMSFYALVYYIIAVFSSLGIAYIFTSTGSVKALTAKGPSPAVIIAALVICATAIGYNYKENDNSSNFVNEDITKNTLSVLEPNAILLTYDYAFAYSSSLYYQQVEKLRPDVKVFILKFLAAPWYLETIKKYYPDVYENIRPEAEDYIKSSEGDEKTRAAKLITLVKAFLSKNFGKFPLYLTVDLVISKDTKSFYSNSVPYQDGLVYKLRELNAPYDKNAGLKSLDANFRKYEPVGFHKTRALVTTAGTYYETAFYHYKNGNSETALKFAEKCLSIDSGFKDALNLKSKILSEKK